MHTSIRRTLGAFCALLLVCNSATAAAISGRVRDANTNVNLLGATVRILENGRSTSTGSGGEFLLSDLPEGDYTLVVSYLGYDNKEEQISVVSDQTVRVDIAVGDEVVQMGAFVIEGTREGQARALQQKRAAANIMDAVSADAVGKFPDGNAAEALRRVPGVSLEIDQSEGRFVVIRGIDAQLNNVTLNGQMVGSPAEQGRRGLSMDSVPADLIARLEVTKAVTPDMDGNAIGGSVNIVTQSVFDRPDGFLFGSLSKGYGNFNEKWGWEGASATFGRLLDKEGTWGLTLGGSYSARNYASQTSDAVDWALHNGYYVPESQESFDYDIERERIGLNLALEHRAKSGHQIFFRANYNTFEDEEGRQKNGFNFARGTLSNQTANSGTFSQGRSTKEFRDYYQKHLIDAYILGGKHPLAGGDYQLEWEVSRSTGERDTPRRVDWEFRSSASAFPSNYVVGDPITIVTPTTDFYDASKYPFRRARFRTDIENEHITSGQVDLKHDMEFGAKPGFWKVGIKGVSSKKHQDRENTNYNLAGTAFTLAEPGLAGAEPVDYLEGRYRFGPTIDLAALQAFFQANPSRFAYDAASSDSNSKDADYDAKEEIFSTYGMASVDLNDRLTLMGGVRVERTESTYSALENRNGTYSPISVPHNYTEVLPGVHMTWRPTERTAVRAAWTNTYGRANYTELAPRNALEDVDLGGGDFQGSLSSGNPNLKPFESMNFDATFEYYLKNAGIVSVGFFHKNIDNPVYGNSYTLRNTTYGGRTYSLFNVSRPENADSGRVTGVEFNWQQFFTSLPSPFDGIGVNFNYTIVDSSATIFGRTDKLPFFKQSDEIGNIALIYEKYGIQFRLAYSFNSDYLDSVGASAAEDTYTDSRDTLDAKITYRLTPHISVFGELTNITEQPLRSYFGIPSRSNGYEIYSWNANFGINWSL